MQGLQVFVVLVLGCVGFVAKLFSSLGLSRDYVLQIQACNLATCKAASVLR